MPVIDHEDVKVNIIEENPGNNSVRDNYSKYTSNNSRLNNHFGNYNMDSDSELNQNNPAGGY